MHTISFNAMKALGKGQMLELCRIRLTNAETSNFLRLNAFFSKNDVRCAKTRHVALKTCLMHTISFNAKKALRMVQMH